MSDNVRIVRELYTSFSERDEVTLRHVLHQNVEWIQCRGFPGGDHHHGVDAVVENVYDGLQREWNDWRVDIDELIDAGKSVVALGKYSGKHAQTGCSMDAVFAHVYDIEAGKIIRFRQYTDTHELVRAATAV